MTAGLGLSIDHLATAVVRRGASLFSEDLESQAEAVRDAICGRRCLVIGGAGSIGRATVRELVRHAPAVLQVVDTDENNLVELVRDLRGGDAVPMSTTLRTSTLDYGSSAMRRHLAAAPTYDRVLNFAAVKHVRAERDVPSLLHMLDVNICKMFDVVEWLGSGPAIEGYFAVSTDKAADPVNLMGASKRFMEHVVLTHPSVPATSARFANVAFSAGSLLAGWLRRLQNQQPLPVPAETRRYFVSPQESGQLCLLASTVLTDGDIAIPRLNAGELRLLTDVVVDVLEAIGLRPAFYGDPAQAQAELPAQIERGHWPVLVTPLDTTGEKPAEKFAADDDVLGATPLHELQVIRVPLQPRPKVAAAVAALTSMVREAALLPAKQELINLLRQLVPELKHSGEGLSLDDRQ